MQAGVETVPLVAGSVDVVISNGVFNLCPDKPAVLAEAFRVLRPGGRFRMADILLEEGATPEEVARKGSWLGLWKHGGTGRSDPVPPDRSPRRNGRAKKIGHLLDTAHSPGGESNV